MKTLKNTILILFSFILSCASVSINAQTAYAKVGTMPIGAADGVAVWINNNDPSKSMIIGASPSIGLGTFNLNGSLIEIINFGKGGAGEVDVRYNFPLGNEKVSIVVSANKKRNTLRIFKVNPVNRLLEEITGNEATSKIKAYGSCLYHSKKTNKFYSFITSHEGLIEQWELFDNGKGKVDSKLVREINIMPIPIDGVSPVTEACVADDDLGWIYFSQENECNIWRYGAEPEDGDKRILMDNAKIKEGDNIEGLAIYQSGNETGYLIASVQGSWKYKIYNRGNDNKYIGTFNVTTADSSGLVEAHDCIELVNVSLGSEFHDGLMVTQNANNKCGRHFQIVPWSSIANLFDLTIDTLHNPYSSTSDSKIK